jgi:hypothetical protein
LVVSEWATGAACILSVEGVLNSATYRTLRDQIIKTALDEPDGVIIDVTRLVVPAQSALAVFTSARWHVAQWSAVPIALVCGNGDGRAAIVRNGITRYVPLFPTVAAATDALSRSAGYGIRRQRAALPAVNGSVARSRQLVDDWLTDWSLIEFIPVAKMIVTVFVENVLAHTDSEPAIRIESNGTTVTVAVEDGSSVLAGRREESCGIAQVAGLAVVAAMSRRWGNAPIPSGKTVFAVIGPENCI